MTVPAPHQEYLRRHDYALPSPAAFSADEVALLVRFGHWMEALTSGAIEPNTPEQQHFVRAARGEVDAQTPFERAWAKRCALLLGAPAASQAPPPAPPRPAPARLEALAAARRRLLAARGELEAEREKVLSAVRGQLDALEARFAGELEEAGRAVAELESEVREEALALGKNLSGPGVQVHYRRGRVTWDGPGLARYAEGHPDLLRFRKVGAPSTAIRYLEAPGQR
jgi:hypothetical protein